MRFFLASLALSLYLCGTLGQSNSHRKFHYGQQVATPDDFFAALIYSPLEPWLPPEYRCGGAWIHFKYVVTTAYCLKYHDEINEVAMFPGTHWSNRERWRGVERRHYYANYSYIGDKFYENDIGLIRVTGYGWWNIGFPIIFNGWGNPGTIEKDQVVMYGYGRTETGSYAPYLKYMKGRLHFADDYFQAKCTVSSCKKGLSFCFEPQGEKERSDYGDNGNPVYYKVQNPDNPEKENRILIGIMSGSLHDPRNIIITNLTSYIGFFDSIIQD